MNITQEQVAALEAAADRLWQEIEALEAPYRAKLHEWCEAKDKANDARLELAVQRRLEDRIKP